MRSILPSSTKFFLSLLRKKNHKFDSHETSAVLIPILGFLEKWKTGHLLILSAYIWGMSTDCHWSMQQLNCNIFGKIVSASDIFWYFYCADLFWYLLKKRHIGRSAMKMEPQSPWEDVAVHLSCNLKKIRISEKDKFGVTLLYFYKIQEH